MTYLDLKGLINETYANFCDSYIKRQTLGADELYPRREVYFVKCIYKTLMNQEGDELIDSLTTEQIQKIITLYNAFSNSTIPIEYT
jgi:hypothetical protein